MNSGRFLLVALATAVFSGCGGSEDIKTTEIVVGSLVPRSGSNTNTYWIQALELAVRDVNAALAATDKGKHVQFKLVTEDYGAVDTSAVPDLVRSLAAQGAKIIQTTSGGTTQVANGLNYDAENPVGIPVIGAPATSGDFENRNIVVAPMPDGSPGYATMAASGTVGASKAAPANGLPVELSVAGWTDMDNWLYRTAPVGVGPASASTAVSTATMREWLSRGPNGDGDLDGNGTVKFSHYRASFGSQCNNGILETLMPDKSKFRCELVPYLGANVADYSFSADAAKMFDNANTSATGSQMYNNADYKAAVGDTFFDAAGKTTSQLPDDGPPDWVVIGLEPGPTPGLIAEYVKTYAGQLPNVVFMGGDGFPRAANFLFLGAATEGVEVGAMRILAANDDSGAYFSAAFETATGSEPMGFDANVYDAMVVGLLGVLKAALPLANPADVTPVDVRDALAHVSVPGEANEVIRPHREGLKKAIELFASNVTDINYEGASGPLDFDAYGTPPNSDYGYYRVENQRFKLKTVFQCVAFPATCDPLDML